MTRHRPSGRTGSGRGVAFVAALLVAAGAAATDATPASADTPQHYLFDSLNSRHCLDVVDWGSYEGANVRQWWCNNNYAQQWELVSATRKWAYGLDGNGDWWYEIVNRANHRCLAVAGRWGWDGADVIVEDCDAGPNQYWAIGFPSPGTVSLRALHSNKCLDVAGISTAPGADVHQWTCWNGPNQSWFKQPSLVAYRRPF